MNAETILMQNVLNNAKRIKNVIPVQDGVVLLCGDSLTPTPIAWLWREWLALGKLHLLAGAPGQGKTTLAIAFAATVTSTAFIANVPANIETIIIGHKFASRNF